MVSSIGIALLALLLGAVAAPANAAQPAGGGASDLGASGTLSSPKSALVSRVGSVHLPRAAVEGVTSRCSDTANGNGHPVYGSGSPGELTSLVWTGTATVTCTAPMLEITDTLIATDPQGVDHVIAEGACAECADLVGSNAGYVCVQSGTTSNCAGTWYLRKEVVVRGQPGSTWPTVGTGCSAAGAELTCTRSAVAGTAHLFNSAPLAACLPSGPSQSGCVELPDGVEMPVLDAWAIAGIRKTHFAGGSKVDDTKGLFLPGVTDSQLETIFEAGLKDSHSFEANEFYYEKTFPMTGVGTSSVEKGSGPSISVTLVIDAYGTVVSMYPQ
ncbi:hypothetical protein AB7952_04245 [Streptomyces sp. PG2]